MARELCSSKDHRAKREIFLNFRNIFFFFFIFFRIGEMDVFSRLRASTSFQWRFEAKNAHHALYPRKVDQEAGPAGEILGT